MARVDMRLPPHPSSVGKARRVVRRTLADVDAARLVDAADTAELLVSELVTNALVHAGTPIELSVSVDEGLRVEVADGSRHLPVIRSYGNSANTGRGLRMLAHMVDQWGARPTDQGKVVWFCLGPSTSGPAEGGQAADHGQVDQGETSSGETPSRPVATGGLVVELPGLPLMLFMAWHQHAEALLRELLLATMEEGSEEDALLVHAQATDALSLLGENVPCPELPGDPDHLLASAGETGNMHADVRLCVPAGSVESFRVLDEALDRATGLAEQGLFLTSATQPEVRMLRRWICAEVASQSAGAHPGQWQLRQMPRPQAAQPLDWDGTPVQESDVPLIAADGDNRILAASRPALALLGYDDPGELVGTALIGIIPPRFRQAHLAGFTLFFLNGRAPLLDRTVTVPALRRDRTEVEVALTVRTEQTPRGEPVFVAEMR